MTSIEKNVNTLMHVLKVLLHANLTESIKIEYLLRIMEIGAFKDFIP